jgi:prevent-host-death family protein
MNKLNITTNQPELIDLIKSVTEENIVYEIEGNNLSAVLISQQDYENLQETLELLSVPNLRESLLRSLQQVKDNQTYSFDEVLGDID